MNINRHNYEEFFLLYVDNELTTEQKKSVMQFVQDNPDLAGELELFRQTSVASDEDIVFEGKELLFKKEPGSLITFNNYEEWLVAYIDNELTVPEREAVEAFVALHPAAATALSVFLQTRLQPEEAVVFPNKEILYRREEKVRVITLSWWKVAVAAAIVLAIGLTTLKIATREAVVPAGVAGTGDKKPAVQNKETPLPEPETRQEQQPAPLAIEKNDAVASTRSAKEPVKEAAVPTRKIAREKLLKNAVVVPEDVATNGAANTKTKEQPVVARVSPANIPAVRSQATLVPVSKPDLLHPDVIAANNTPVKENINNKPVTNVPDKPYNTIETAPEQKDIEPVFVSNNEGSNKKTRGFFRKATRIFEKRTNISAADDDDKVLIGVLAVRLK
jgi:hypothetical protein